MKKITILLVDDHRLLKSWYGIIIAMYIQRCSDTGDGVEL
jgi:hypothetical protein